MSIPPNDPQRPRWLLDLENWEIQPYDQVPREILDTQGYGIVSYTWGYIVDTEKRASDIPRGIFWDIPATTKWPLSKAREVMENIGTRYIWWDWMCVPQGGKPGAPESGMKPLTPELKTVQGEEIGKQLHIYSNAKKSIIWLHSTSWEEESALRTLLRLRMPYHKDHDPIALRKYMEHAEIQIGIARENEYWFRSGWTLQEGALLGRTHLVDGNGNTLPGNGYDSSDRSTVDDITSTVSFLAYNVADAYFIRNQGHDSNPTRPSTQFSHSVSKGPCSTPWMRRLVKSLAATGLVLYGEENPLEILAGKQSRKFGVEKDSCWALLGALRLEGVPVTYDPNVTMDEVKRIFLKALFDKYQWRMLFLPLPEFRIEEKGVERDFKWLDVADGVLLPASLFTVQTKISPDQEWPPKPPILSYSDDLLRIKANMKKIVLYRISKENIFWFRHYRQDSDGLRIVSPKEVAFAEDKLLQNALFFPWEDVDEKDGIPGKRGIALLRFNGQTSDDQPAYADFGGMIDIWDLGPEKVEVDEIVVNPPPAYSTK